MTMHRADSRVEFLKPRRGGFAVFCTVSVLCVVWWQVSYKHVSSNMPRGASTPQDTMKLRKIPQPWQKSGPLEGTTLSGEEPRIEAQTVEHRVEIGTRLTSLATVEALPPVPYRLLYFSQAYEAAMPCCEKRVLECLRYHAMKEVLLLDATTSGEERLHLIPLDPLNMIREDNPTLFMRLLERLVEDINEDGQYLRYKGSDFVFICVTDGCQQFAGELGKMLSDGRGTRAIFAGTGVNQEQINWPCPRRTIQLEYEGLLETTSLVNQILTSAAEMVKKANRWICEDNSHPVHYFSPNTTIAIPGGILLNKYNFMMCPIHKSGSSMMMFLLRRMMHQPDWRSRENGLPHNPELTGLDHLDNADHDTLNRIHQDVSLLKATIVRHPVPRLLSSYLDKIQILQEYERLDGLTEYVEQYGEPSFPEFVEYLIKHYPDPDTPDDHFCLQSSLCSLRDLRYDFVGKLDDLGAEFQEFSKSLGFFEEFVANGWGQDQTQQFGVRAYQPDQRWSRLQLWDYYTEELMMKVYNYYEEDFTRFDFSLEEVMMTKPQDPIAN